ncbi:MAG: transcription antitermination factor NusB [Phycisphaerae bacterium]
MLDARTACARLLKEWIVPGDPPRIPSAENDFWSQIPSMERGAAMDLLSGILRRRITLDTVINAVSHRPSDQLDPVVRAILWVGIYQLLFSDHIADYAAIDSSVRLAAKLNRNRAGGFINAVLRSIQRLKPTGIQNGKPSARSCPMDRHRWLTFNRDIFPSPLANKISYWAHATSIPEELVKASFSALGDKAVTFFIDANVRPPVICRLDRPFVPEDSARLQPHADRGWALVVGGVNGEIIAAIERGDISPQDPTAGVAAAWMIDAMKAADSGGQACGEVLDLCAGRGTKTVQMAMAALRVTATDIDGEKLQLLAKREANIRTGRIHILPTLPLAINPPVFAGVLVDVPCSNTGVLARRPEVRWRIMSLDIPSLRNTQMKLLRRGAELAREILIYSTCSVLPDENQNLIRLFLAGDQGKPWELVREVCTLPMTEPQSWHDGGYAALLKRRA